MSFKLTPFVTFHDADTDREVRPEAHYTFEMKSIAMEAIKEETRTEDYDYDVYKTEDGLTQEEVAKSIIKGGKTLNGIKTIHFDETCKVPRFKLGEICGKQGIKVVRDRSKADAVIYGNKFLDAVIHDSSAGSFNYKADFIAQAKKVKCKRNLITEIIPQVEACGSDIILLDDWDDGNGNTNRLSVKKRDKNDAEPEFELNYWEIVDESKYLSSNHNLIHQDVILEQLSSIVMDEPMYKSLCSMFESVDSTNHIVAMEVMSNTAYRESIVYLLDLMRKYYSNKINDINEKNNISFKAFREYIEYEPGHRERSFNAIIEVIAGKGALTEANYKLILKLIMEEENLCMSGEPDEDDEDNWRITSVDLAPKYKAKVIWDKKEELILTEAL